MLFYTLWFLLSIHLAYSAELLDDEAYYWFYSNNLSWGYYDHPPMVAVLIKGGYLLFKNEFGVRLLMILCNLFTIYFIEKLIAPENKKLFFIIIFSLGYLSIAGLFAVPDTPLLLFTAIFYYCLKKYLNHNTLLNASLLGIVIALLLLSKYQSILVVGFTVITQLHLFKRKSIILTISFAIIIFLPHVYWQIALDFPTLKYHLVGRNNVSYNIVDTVVYIVTQPLIYGPIIGFWLFFKLFTYKVNNSFENTLKVNAIGTLFFFLLMSIKGPVEGNWTIIILVPLVYIAYSSSLNKVSNFRFIYKQLPYTIGILLLVRLFLTTNVIVDLFTIKSELHYNKLWAKQIQSKIGNTPIAFINSYQKASKYKFYSNNDAFPLSMATGRKSQFNILDIEGQHQNSKVILALNYNHIGCPVIPTSKGDIYYSEVNNFYSYGNVDINLLDNKIYVGTDSILKTAVQFSSLSNHTRLFRNNTIKFIVCKNGNKLQTFNTNFVITDSYINNNKYYPISTAMQLPKGTYTVYFFIDNLELPASRNSKPISLIIP